MFSALVDFYEALLKSTNDEKIPDLEASQIQFKVNILI